MQDADINPVKDSEKSENSGESTNNDKPTQNNAEQNNSPANLPVADE